MSEVEGGALRQVAAVFGFVWDDAAVVAGKERLEAVTQQVQVMSETFGGKIIDSLKEFVSEMTEVGSELNDAADNLGITTDAVQELQFAFGQAGVRGNQVNNALSGLSVRMEDAAAGAGSAGAAFSRLHIRLKDAHGAMRPVSEIMPEIAHAMSGVTDPAERVRLSMHLFGGVGRRLVGVLHDGEGGLADMREQLERLGGGMSTEAVHAADAYGDSLGSLQTAMLSVKSTVAVWLLPKLAALTNWVALAVGKFAHLVRGTRIVEVAFVALGAIIVSTMGPAALVVLELVLPFIAMGAAIALAVVLVEDLWGAFNGADSVIGRLIDLEFGANSTRDAVAGIKLAWMDLTEVVEDFFSKMADLTGVSTALHGIRNTILEAAGVDTSAYDRQDAAQAAIDDRRRVTRRREIVAGSVVPTPAAPAAHGRHRTQRVAAPGAAAPTAATTHVTQHVTHGPTTIQVSGVGSPEQVAQRALRLFTRQQQDQRDAAHPLLPRED